MISGGVVSTTVMTAVAVEVFPKTSETSNVTVVSPRATGYARSLVMLDEMSPSMSSRAAAAAKKVATASAATSVSVTPLALQLQA